MRIAQFNDPDTLRAALEPADVALVLTEPAMTNTIHLLLPEPGYGAFGLRELYPLLQRINYYLVRWLRKKYRRLRTWKKLLPCWERITSQYPEMFAHWRQVKWYWRTG